MGFRAFFGKGHFMKRSFCSTFSSSEEPEKLYPVAKVIEMVKQANASCI